MSPGSRGYGGSGVWIDDPVNGLSELTKQQLAGPNIIVPVLTSQQLYILRVIALAGASISLTTGIIVGWWFVRMKRSFRHQLIMLLIFSDFFKASWQLIYPTVVFTRGAVESPSKFCQASGFFMSMGIEASDFAVLTIAVHSALYIFRPGLNIGEGGLYRYRYYVYTAWSVFSILMPSLAFVNSSPAYTSQGTFCYLPVRPFWFRDALAWVPRYIILMTILILYTSIYIYVRIKFLTFRTNVGSSTLEMETVDRSANNKTLEVPPRLPSLDAHGLIPPSPRVEPRQSSNSSDQPFAKALLAPLEKFQLSPSSPGSETRSANYDPTYSPPRRGSLPTAYDGGMFSPLESPVQNNRARDTASAEMRRRRIEISRQLRLLFIYPLVYALMWSPSLVSHILQYTDHFVKHPSFPLACVVAFAIPVQCAADCWLFTIREKPWRYIPASHGKNWWCKYGFGFQDVQEDAGEKEGETWRNRKHMSFEARKAYERREEEMKEAEEAAWMSRRGSASKVDGIKQGRSWWDVDDHVEDIPEGEEDEDENEDGDGDREAEEKNRQRSIDELSALENGTFADGRSNSTHRA